MLIPVGALALGQLFDDDDDKDDQPAPDPTQGTQGDDTLAPEPGFSGRVMGRGGDDQITVTSPTDPDSYFDSTLRDDGGHWTNWPNWSVDATGGVPPGVVLGQGGDGDDTLTGTGQGIDLGGDAGDDVIQITGEATGRNSVWSVVARGGDGNDTITASGESVRVLGGAGDDLILFDRADTVTGGAGADRMTGFVETGHTAIVTDFTAGQDVLHVNLNPDESTVGQDAFGNVTVTEQDGATLIQMQGQDVVRIEGATGLRIGLEIGDTVPDPDGYAYVDLNGNPVDPASLDVILNRYEVFST